MDEIEITLATATAATAVETIRARWSTDAPTFRVQYLGDDGLWYPTGVQSAEVRSAADAIRCALEHLDVPRELRGAFLRAARFDR